MKILVASLNWGLGHATRCIPIINRLKERNIEVVIASDGRASHLLRAEYPNDLHIELPAYDVNYNGHHFFWNLIRQAPKIIRAINAEKKVVEQLIENHHISAIISDNRFGCHSKKAHSIFMTHQINLISYNPLLTYFGNKINHTIISQFNKVWIPDVPGHQSLSGHLGRVNKLDSCYIGILSRMEKKDLPRKYDIAIILSGPEPKRTELEKKLVVEAEKVRNKKIILVQGRTEAKFTEEQRANIKIVSYLNSQELNRVICSSELIVSRSGYSTIMDLSKLKKKALLIPTPGQTEQEYLAKDVLHRKLFNVQLESNIDLKKAYLERNNFEPLDINLGGELLDHAIDELLAKL